MCLVLRLLAPLEVINCPSPPKFQKRHLTAKFFLRQQELQTYWKSLPIVETKLCVISTTNKLSTRPFVGRWVPSRLEREPLLTTARRFLRQQKPLFCKGSALGPSDKCLALGPTDKLFQGLFDGSSAPAQSLYLNLDKTARNKLVTHLWFLCRTTLPTL